jgi:hypothetical protein
VFNKFAFQVGAFPLTPGGQKRGELATSPLRIERLQAHKAGERVSVFRSAGARQEVHTCSPFAVGECKRRKGTFLFVFVFRTAPSATEVSPEYEPVVESRLLKRFASSAWIRQAPSDSMLLLGKCRVRVSAMSNGKGNAFGNLASKSLSKLRESIRHFRK